MDDFQAGVLKRLTLRVWTKTSISPPIWATEASTLEANKLLYAFNGNQDRMVVRLPVDIPGKGSLCHFIHFHEVKNLFENEVQFWQFNVDGITFKIFND